jgi:phosphate/sulfate permease
MQHQLASRFCRLQPLQALSAEGATTVCVGLSTFLGFSISTSQVLTNATLGSALAYQPKKIRWSYFSDLIRVWLTTLPASALLAALVAKGLLYVVS